jgi:hypothetical protein
MLEYQKCEKSRREEFRQNTHIIYGKWKEKYIELREVRNHRHGALSKGVRMV